MAVATRSAALRLLSMQPRTPTPLSELPASGGSRCVVLAMRSWWPSFRSAFRWVPQGGVEKTVKTDYLHQKVYI